IFFSHDTFCLEFFSLSLHDALPILSVRALLIGLGLLPDFIPLSRSGNPQTIEPTSRWPSICRTTIPWPPGYTSPGPALVFDTFAAKSAATSAALALVV